MWLASRNYFQCHKSKVVFVACVHISTEDTLLSVQSCSITSIQSGTSPSIVQENEAAAGKTRKQAGRLPPVQNNIYSKTLYLAGIQQTRRKNISVKRINGNIFPSTFFDSGLYRVIFQNGPRPNVWSDHSKVVEKGTKPI